MLNFGHMGIFPQWM